MNLRDDNETLDKIKGILNGVAPVEQNEHNDGEEPENARQKTVPDEPGIGANDPEADEGRDVQEVPHDEEEDAEEGVSSEDDSAEVARLSELLGVPEDQLVLDEATGKVKIRVKNEDGIEMLLDPAQAAQLATKQKQEPEAKEPVTPELELEPDELMEAAQLVQKGRMQLEAAKAQIDWESLREENPGEYAAKIAEFQALERELQQHEQRVAQQYALYQQKKAQEEVEKLKKLIPEWQNPSVAKKEAEELVQFLRDKGLTDQQIGAITDASLIAALRDAMLFNKMRGKEVEKPRVKKLKTTRRKETADLDKKKQQKLRERIRKTGDVKDVAEFLKGKV